MEKVLFIFGLHYIADFPLQGEFLAQMKGSKVYLLFAHSMIYATVLSAGLLYFSVFSVWKFFILMVSHMLIDSWKCRKPKDEEHWHLIYYDQAGHLLINLVLLII